MSYRTPEEVAKDITKGSRTVSLAEETIMHIIREVRRETLREYRQRVYAQNDGIRFVHDVLDEMLSENAPQPKRCRHCGKEIVKKNVLGKYVWRHALTDSIYCVTTAEPEED